MSVTGTGGIFGKIKWLHHGRYSISNQDKIAWYNKTFFQFRWYINYTYQKRHPILGFNVISFLFSFRVY